MDKLYDSANRLFGRQEAGLIMIPVRIKGIDIE